MNRKYQSYEGHWSNFPQSIEEFLNYVSVGTQITVHYENLTCPKTRIQANQLGMKYDKKIHNKQQVTYVVLDNVKGLVIYIKEDLEKIPKLLLDHHNGLCLTPDNNDADIDDEIDKQMSIFDYLD